MLLASTSTKRGQSDGSAIPMGPPISRGGSPLPSAPTTGVTTPPHTTATTGITALITIGNTAAGSRQQAAGSRQQGLRSRPLSRLAQDEGSGLLGGEAGSGGGLA